MDIRTVERSFTPTEDRKAATGKTGIAASAHPAATAAAVSILKQGGNAVDAACACSLALGVCEPQASGLGGQSMMLLYTGKKPIAIDGSSRAPSLVHVNAVYKPDRAHGYRATTVPSTLATLGYAHRRYGALCWNKIVAPAIALAEDGYPITELQHRLQEREVKFFKKVESQSGAAYFLNNGKPYPAGSIFKQPDLAKLLKRIADKGAEEFYTGLTAKKIDADMREHGGLLRADDLALIPWPIERRPLVGNFHRLKIYTMPPPGAGRPFIFILAMLGALPAARLNRLKIKKARLLVEIFRKAFWERVGRPFDPNFYPQVPGEKMLRASFAHECIRKIVKSVDPNIPIRESEDEASGETTHFSVMDRTGMTVSLTQSIERVYGSKAAAQGLGFLYNNYLMDFEYKEPSHPFYLRPNAQPWATVAPTIVFYKKEPWMALGSPGSERSLTAMAQFLERIVNKNENMDLAMRAPRIHCSLGGKVSLEAERFDADLLHSLEKRGYRMDLRSPYSFYMGAIHAVLKKHSNQGFQGVAEVRRDGTAEGINA